MKNSGIVAALAMVLGIGGMTVSCEKEALKPVKEHTAKMTTEHAKLGGDDDEDPVIRGKVKKNNFVAVDSAFVETMTYGTNVRVDSVYTDSIGQFQQKVAAGIYYFKVTVPGFSSPVITDTVHVYRDVQVEIIVD